MQNEFQKENKKRGVDYEHIWSNPLVAVQDKSNQATLKFTIA